MNFLPGWGVCDVFFVVLSNSNSRLQLGCWSARVAAIHPMVEHDANLPGMVTESVTADSNDQATCVVCRCVSLISRRLQPMALLPPGMEPAVQQQHPPDSQLGGGNPITALLSPSSVPNGSHRCPNQRIRSPSDCGPSPPRRNRVQLGCPLSHPAPRVQRSTVARVGSKGMGRIPRFPGNPSLGAECVAQRTSAHHEQARSRESNPSPLRFAPLKAFLVGDA